MFKSANNKKQILLVDDDRSVTEMLAMLLETRGYEVTTAHSGREALQKASRGTDLILLDVVLPDQEGFQVCRKLKENEQTRHIAVIILTAKLLTHDIVRGLYLGADDYLVKPFEYEELVARMEAVMRRSSYFQYAYEFSKGEEDVILGLKQIIDGELIVPYFQPIILLEPFTVFGFECLSRPETQGLLRSPEMLFKAAIQYGVYQDLEFLAWKKAMEYASGQIQGRKLFLNCNPYLIESSKFNMVQALFDKYHIRAEDVYLEITERSAIRNFKAFYKGLSVYREYGFKFAVDDVGGGYASLESIVETRPEVVKIDRHIVHKLDSDDLRCSIVRFIVSLCREHNILSVAEGVETREDFETVKALGVDAGQGYYFRKPAPEVESTDTIMESIKVF